MHKRQEVLHHDSSDVCSGDFVRLAQRRNNGGQQSGVKELAFNEVVLDLVSNQLGAKRRGGTQKRQQQRDAVLVHVCRRGRHLRENWAKKLICKPRT